jgi:hypothetical protein
VDKFEDPLAIELEFIWSMWNLYRTGGVNPPLSKESAEQGMGWWTDLLALNNAPPSNQMGSQRINRYPLPKRIDINHIEGKGVGYFTGYTKTTIVLGPDFKPGSFLPLVELCGTVFDDGKLAATAGLMLRYVPERSCSVVGFNIFYDFRQGNLGNYNQVSAGLEVLNKRWELHAKGLAPVGTIMHTKGQLFDDYIGDFWAKRNTNEFAFYAFESSLGYYLINGKNVQLYAAAGPYYIHGKFGIQSWGGKALLRPQFFDWFEMELSVSHDEVFGTIYQVNAILSIPLYNFSSTLKKKKGPCGMSKRQLYQPFDPDIILDRKCCWEANFGEEAVCH